MIQPFFLQGSGWRLDGVVLSLPDRSLTVEGFRLSGRLGVQGFSGLGFQGVGCWGCNGRLDTSRHLENRKPFLSLSWPLN